MKKSTKKFSGKKVVGTEVIATIKVQPHMYINAHVGRNGVFDEKTDRNRKNKAAQKGRRDLEQVRRSYNTGDY